MASAKFRFLPSSSPSTVGYKIQTFASKYSKGVDLVDIGVPPIVDGKMEMVVPDLPLANTLFGIVAYNSVGEDSPPTPNLVQFDPRIEPPTELEILDI